MVDVSCNLCGSNDFTILYPSRYSGDVKIEDMFSASKGHMSKDQVVRCSRCGLVYVNPRFSEEDIVRAYSAGDDTVYVSQEENRIKTFERLASQMGQYSEKGRVLDVGAAAGFFMEAAKRNGWDVHGVEPNAWMADYAKNKFGLDIRKGTLRDAKFPDGHFKVVTLWDVLEHTYDPSAELREAARILEKNGTVIVNYPDFDSIFSRIFRRRWWFVLSVHLYYFTPKTMASMLEKSGFEVMANKRHWQSLSFGYLVNMINHLSTNPLAKLLYRFLKFFSDMGLSEFPITYYAGQRLMVARKR